MKVHCLFEQSGTFKNEFKKLGFVAYDYDINDSFNETDLRIDLFKEIESAYSGSSSIFDTFTEDDLLFAFFPCIRFESQIIMSIKGTQYGLRNWTDLEKLDYNRRLMNELFDLYNLFTKMVYVCIKRKLKIIIENPYSEQHFLTRYLCFKPAVIDYDRTFRGDYFIKPTQYFFFNLLPKNNFIFEDIKNDNHITVNSCKRCDEERSLISPGYANRFIREFIL